MIYSIYRLEKIVFGKPSDIINNLLDDKSEMKTKDEHVDVCEKIRDDNKDDKMNNEDREDESDQNISILNHGNNTKTEEKKPAWIDEDDYIYT